MITVTKEREREALEKIRSIVNDLGKNSCVSIALEASLAAAEKKVNECIYFSGGGVDSENNSDKPNSDTMDYETNLEERYTAALKATADNWTK